MILTEADYGLTGFGGLADDVSCPSEKYEPASSLSVLPLDAWDAFSFGDLTEILYGSDRIRGYFLAKRRLSLKTLELIFSDGHQSNLPVLSPPDFLSQFHQRRLGHYENRRMVFWKGRVGEDGQEYGVSGYIPKTILCRGLPGYQARVGDLFDDLKSFMISKNLPAVHVRLSPRAEFGRSPLDSLLDVKGIVNRFLSWLSTRLGYRPHYVWVVEPTKRGHGHIHFLFIGTDWLIGKERLDSWFTDQGLGDKSGVWIERLREPDHLQMNFDGTPANRPADLVLGYLIKYLLKPHSDQHWCGLLSLTRKREWGMSNNLRSKIARWKEESEKERLTSIGLTNSNSPDPFSDPRESKFVGILELGEIDVFILRPETPPKYDDLLETLQEIHGYATAWAHSTGGLWEMFHRDTGRP